MVESTPSATHQLRNGTCSAANIGSEGFFLMLAYFLPSQDMEDWTDEKNRKKQIISTCFYT